MMHWLPLPPLFVITEWRLLDEAMANAVCCRCARSYLDHDHEDHRWIKSRFEIDISEKN